MTTTPTTTTAVEVDRTYGNWQRPPRGGLFNLGNTGTIVASMVVVASILLLMMFGLLIGVAALIVGQTLVALASIQNAEGRSTFDRLRIRRQYKKAKSVGEVTHRAALTPEGFQTLPGMLGKVGVTEHLDVLGRPFALLSWPGEYYTAVWHSSPDGAAGADTHDVDTMVAYYNEWLSKQASVPGLIGSSIIIETAPDTGGQLSRHINGTGKDTASALAKEVMGAIARTYPEGSAEYRAYATMTFAPKGRIERIRNREDRVQAMAESLANDMHDLVSDLTHAGAGTMVPMDVQTLCEQVRVAYDPAVAADVDQARAEGVAIESMDWSSAGPVAYQAGWKYMRHDSGASVTYGMTVPPRQNVTAGVLTKLLAPAPFARKRVAMVYNVLPEYRAGKVAEQGVSDAVFARNASKRKTAALDVAVESARRTAREEAGGAGIADFTIYATATVLDETKIEPAATALQNLTGTAKVRMRRLYGWQDGAFLTTLPLGIQVDKHVPKSKFVAAFTDFMPEG